MTTETTEEAVERTNASAKPPVIFIHGLWLKPNSWDRWVEMFAAAGYAAFAPCWPAEAGGAAAPETIGELVAHFTGIAEALNRRPAVVGHSFGGVIAQALAGQGLPAATVAIDPPPFRGVVPPSVSALRPAWPVLEKAAIAHRKVSLTQQQFRHGFGNAVPRPESEALYNTDQTPAPGRPILQAAAAHPSPSAEVRVDTRAARGGPLLVISGDRDNSVPRSAPRADDEQQKSNRQGITEFVQLAGRGHSLTVGTGWQEVAQTALTFVGRFL
jgi:pimeloyl-ACP methyl ester carboxylesterase